MIDVNANDGVTARIKELTGVDTRGFRVTIEARQIEHILKDHGEDGAADHSMADPGDIAKIEYALENPDTINSAGTTRAYVTMKNGKMKPADTVIYEKQNGDGSYYVVQAVPDTKKKTLYVVTAFIGKSGYKNMEAPQSTNANSPGATPTAESAVTSNNNIPQPMPGVNGEVVADEVESAEGKVLRGNTAVQIAGVVNTDSGKLQVKLTDGSTADVSELSFPETGEAELWRVVTEYAGTAEAAQTILQEYRNSDLDASRFARGVEEGILFGSVNMSPKEMNRRGNYVYMLSKAQRDMVYQIGQARGELQTQKREQAVRAGRNVEGIATEPAALRNDKVRRTGGVHYGYEGHQVDKSRLGCPGRHGHRWYYGWRLFRNR